LVHLTLKNQSIPLGDEEILVKFEKYHTKTKTLSEGSYHVKTLSNGTQICDGRTELGNAYYYSYLMDDSYYDAINFTIIYVSKEFSLTTQSIAFKVNPVEATLTLAPSTRQYDPNFQKSDFIPVEGIRLDFDNGGRDYCVPEMEYAVYKNNKLVFKSYIDQSGGYHVSGMNLDAGTYKVIISNYVYSVFSFQSKTTTLKITPAKATVKAPKVSAKLKKSKYFKVTVKLNKKPVKDVKVKVKVYTGKKSKIYTLKTNKKGVASLNTKKLKKGKHKVVISSGNANYKISAKSQITIK
jgi:hypothetical protein